MGLGLVNAALAFLQVGGAAVIAVMIQALILGVGIRIGVGLWQRQKAAFWGWCFLALLASLGTLLFVGARLATSGTVYVEGVKVTYPVALLVLANWGGCYAFPMTWTVLNWRRIRWS